MSIKEVLVAGIALLSMSSASFATHLDLKPPKDLSINFRDREWSAVSGTDFPIVDGLPFAAINEYSSPFTWSPKYGIGMANEYIDYNRDDDQYYPKDYPLVFHDSEFFQIGVPAKMSGLWLDDMKGPVTVGLNDPVTYYPDKFGDALVVVANPEVTLDGASDSFHVAGFVDPAATNKVAEGGNLLIVFAAALGGLFLIKSRSHGDAPAIGNARSDGH